MRSFRFTAKKTSVAVLKEKVVRNMNRRRLLLDEASREWQFIAKRSENNNFAKIEMKKYGKINDKRRDTDNSALSLWAIE